jgi:hypothetical protein
MSDNNSFSWSEEDNSVGEEVHDKFIFGASEYGNYSDIDFDWSETDIDEEYGEVELLKTMNFIAEKGKYNREEQIKKALHDEGILEYGCHNHIHDYARDLRTGEEFSLDIYNKKSSEHFHYKKKDTSISIDYILEGYISDLFIEYRLRRSHFVVISKNANDEDIEMFLKCIDVFNSSEKSMVKELIKQGEPNFVRRPIEFLKKNGAQFEQELKTN